MAGSEMTDQEYLEVQGRIMGICQLLKGIRFPEFLNLVEIAMTSRGLGPLSDEDWKNCLDNLQFLKDFGYCQKQAQNILEKFASTKEKKEKKIVVISEPILLDIEKKMKKT